MSTKIAVVGMGYVGIPAAALLADVDGYDVTGVQRRSERSGWKIEALNTGKCPFEGDEPGLDELIARVVEKGTFRVTDDYSVLKDMDIILIDVQTPTDDAEHTPSYTSLKEVSREVGTHMKKGCMVVTESTVAPGTTENVVKPILEEKSGMKAGGDFDLAYSYERVMPGKLIDYIVNMPRVVGGINKQSEKRAVQMYKKICKQKIDSTDILTAETAKTMENAYRDVNIAFANEMALVAENLGVDIWEIRELVNSRSQRDMHMPGSGVGGHCLPKDTWLLRYGVQEYGMQEINTDFICLARNVNDFMPVHMANMAKESIEKSGGKMKESKVAILGVAYLEDSDDTRNTPAYSLIKELDGHGTEIIAHDPFVRTFPEAELTRDLEEAVTGADAIAIVTKHSEYLDMDLAKIKKLMRTPIIVDGRNIIKKDEAEKAGFTYRGIGKGK